LGEPAIVAALFLNLNIPVLPKGGPPPGALCMNKTGGGQVLA
jgi:hypothetical protein